MRKMKKIERLAGWIKQSSFTVVLTGAGMSTESGLPDFRSKSGWWKSYDPTVIASVDALETDYPLFHEFYTMRLKTLERCSPTGALYTGGLGNKGLNTRHRDAKRRRFS